MKFLLKPMNKMQFMLWIFALAFWASIAYGAFLTYTAVDTAEERIRWKLKYENLVFNKGFTEEHLQAAPPVLAAIGLDYTLSTDDVHKNKLKAEIGNRHFLIPRAYTYTKHSDADIVVGSDEEKVSIEYILPNYESSFELMLGKESINKAIEDGRYTYLFLSTDKLVAPTEDMKTSFDLKRTTEYDQNGLEAYKPGPKSKKKNLRNVFYFGYDADGEVQDLLSCTPASEPQKAREDCKDTDESISTCFLSNILSHSFCLHIFRDKSMTYNIAAKNDYFPNWQKHRQDVIDFVEQYEITE